MPTEERVLRLESCTVDLQRGMVFRDAVRVPLTQRELALVAYFAARPGKLVARDTLLSEVWAFDPKVVTRAVDLAVSRLRRKIEANPARPRHLLTVHGEGYRFEPHSGEPEEGGPGAATPVGPELTSFVGRQGDLEVLARMVDRARLTTIVGPPGVGKTRLARRFAARYAEPWPGGAWFCDLAEARDATDVSAVVTAALGYRTDRDVAELLAERPPTLLVLDNFEQVVGAAAVTVGRWLAGDARFVATSRERLNLRGEEVMVLGPLDREAAMRLFEERCPAPLRPDDRPSVSGIVQRLDLLPLAIELAAGRTDVLSPEALLKRLASRFDVLRSRARDGPDRQATLEAAIAWSWDLLDPWEQDALAQCCVFRGGFTLEAAEAVLDLSAWDEAPSTLDALHALWDKSLVDVRPGPPRRFRLLESIRAYAGGRLTTAREALEDRHAAWFITWAEGLRERIWGQGGDRLRRDLAAETDNLRAVVARFRETDPERGVRAVLALRPALYRLGPFGLWLGLCDQAVALASSLDAAWRARARWVRAEARVVLGEMAGLEPELLEASRLAAEAGDRLTAGRALVSLGDLHRHRGELDASERRYRDALEWVRGAGVVEGNVRDALGGVLHRLGRLDEAEQQLGEALMLMERHGSESGRHTSRHGLATVRYVRGDLADARALFEECLAYERDAGDRANELITRHSLGCIALEGGHLDRATAELRAVVEGLVELDAKLWLPEAHATLGLALHMAGDLDEARRCYDASGGPDKVIRALAASFLAALEAEEGRLDAATVAMDTVRRLVSEIDVAAVDGLLACAEAHLALARGDRAAALDTLSALRPPSPHLRHPHTRMVTMLLARALSTGSSEPRA